MYQDYQPSKPFDDFRNIEIGEARIIFEGDSYWGMPGWKLPGQRTTVDRDEAFACAIEMNGLMGGPQVVA